MSAVIATASFALSEAASGIGSRAWVIRAHRSVSDDATVTWSISASHGPLTAVMMKPELSALGRPRVMPGGRPPPPAQVE